MSRFMFYWYWREWELGVYRSKVTRGMWRIDLGPLMILVYGVRL